MVGRLVEQQQVGLLQQQPAQRHAARSPPDSLSTSASPGGQRSASIAISTVRSSLPAVGGVDLLLQLRLLGQQVVHLVVVHRLGERALTSLKRSSSALVAANALHDVALHVLGRVELGSCGR
jgi:hypothetical protein